MRITQTFCLLLIICCNFFTANGQSIVNPVLPGDRPDPTIIEIDGIYWASATSNEWAPLFPIFKSTDMINWELVSYVLPNGAPSWALNNFWAPELAYDKQTKKVYLYYTARRKDNHRLAIAVASADSPDGEFHDHGPLISQEAGSIDAFEITDEQGKIYVIWKEDGNSIGQPTPIWAQEINKERTQLMGERVELLRNNEQQDNSWERWLIEGVCIFKAGEFYYATYSGGGCCNKYCDYKTGVARSKSILGPWEKYSKNPILKDNKHWKCAGHGTVISHNKDWYMLYHAYNTTSDVYVGRQGVLEKIYWTDDGWPYFKNDACYNKKLQSLDFTDNFNSSDLNEVWQWSVKQKIQFSQGLSGLKLYASQENGKIGTLLVQQTKSLNYSLSAKINIKKSGERVNSGIALIGGSDNGFGAPIAAIGISANKKEVEIWKVVHGKRETILKKAVQKNKIKLNMKVQDGYRLFFAYEVEPNKQVNLLSDWDASSLVPWGMGFRFGILAEGNNKEYAVFNQVKLENK